MRTPYGPALNARLSVGRGPCAWLPTLMYVSARPTLSLSRPANGAFMHDAEVRRDAHQVAVARRAHHAREHAEAARLVGIGPPDHLVGHRVEAVVAMMRSAAMPVRAGSRATCRYCRSADPRSCRCCTRHRACRCRANRRRRAPSSALGRLVDRVLQLADPQRTVVQVEVGAALVVGVVAERVAVEHAASAVSDGVIWPRTRTPSADSGYAGPPTACRTDGSPGQPNIVLMKVAEYWLAMNSWSILCCPTFTSTRLSRNDC